MPFCKRKCLYCDFYSVIYDDKLAGRYVDILLRQIDDLPGELSTIYIGGGTPTVLENSLIERLLDRLQPRLNKTGEFTIEANPESLDEEKINLFLDKGVNRLSIGVQSLDDRKLQNLGRMHNSRAALDAVALATKRGLKNINIDLIFGVWGEDPKRWKKEVSQAARLPITHVSCYSLTYEKSTPLFLAVKNKSIIPLEDEIVAGMYETAIDILALGGFKQYEMSNFASTGFECRHNLNCWENNPYTGLGASAASYVDGVRSKNVSDVTEYIRRAGEGRSLAESSEKLSPVKRAKETAAVKIRTKEGIDFAAFREKTGFDFLELEKKALPGLIDQGLVKYKKDRDAVIGVVLKRKGFLFCDTVSSALL